MPYDEKKFFESSRKFLKELFDIAKNAAFVAGIKYFADKTDSAILHGFYLFTSGLLLAYVYTFLGVNIVTEKVSERVGSPRAAKILGALISFVLVTGFIWASGEAINAIAIAQKK